MTGRPPTRGDRAANTPVMENAVIDNRASSKGHGGVDGVVEIDALDVHEWEHGQRTPQATDANLAALVQASVRASSAAPPDESAPVAAPHVPPARPGSAPPIPATRAPRSGPALSTFGVPRGSSPPGPRLPGALPPLAAPPRADATPPVATAPERVVAPVASVASPVRLAVPEVPVARPRAASEPAASPHAGGLPRAPSPSSALAPRPSTSAEGSGVASLAASAAPAASSASQPLTSTSSLPGSDFSRGGSMSALDTSRPAPTTSVPGSGASRGGSPSALGSGVTRAMSDGSPPSGRLAPPTSATSALGSGVAPAVSVQPASTPPANVEPTPHTLIGVPAPVSGFGEHFERTRVRPRPTFDPAPGQVSPGPPPTLPQRYGRVSSAPPSPLVAPDARAMRVPDVDVRARWLPAIGRRALLWTAGAAVCAGVVAALLVGAGSGADPSSTVSTASSAPVSPAAPTTSHATPPTRSPSTPSSASRTSPAAVAAIAPPAVHAASVHPMPGELTAPPAVRSPAAPIAQPVPARPRPARRPPARLGGKRVVVEYAGRGNEIEAPGLVAQATEDPAVGRARSAYLAGNARLFAGDTSGAIRAYRSALEVYPGYVGGYRGLGLAYDQRGDRTQALQAFKAYVSAVPTARDVPLIQKRIQRLEHAGGRLPL